MSTLTADEEFAIHQKLHRMHIPSGLGTEESACSIAAINLALTGRLTDQIPACMSEVVGQWIIRVQDAMPDAMRNSDRWKNLLPLAAGTGREHEQERLKIILDWMWTTVLPTLQPLADRQGFGEAWRQMTKERTAAAAEAAAWAAAKAKAKEAAWAAAWAEAWESFDPCGVLQKLVEVGD